MIQSTKNYGMDIALRMRDAGLQVQRIDTLSYFIPADLERGDDRYLSIVRKAA
jgi:hypothetical protein